MEFISDCSIIPNFNVSDISQNVIDSILNGEGDRHHCKNVIFSSKTK